jgi:hypothetical protein
VLVSVVFIAGVFVAVFSPASIASCALALLASLDYSVTTIILSVMLACAIVKAGIYSVNIAVVAVCVIGACCSALSFNTSVVE